MHIFITKGTDTLSKCPVIFTGVKRGGGAVNYLAWSGKVISVRNMMARGVMEV
jgi:hypothetical protein